MQVYGKFVIVIPWEEHSKNNLRTHIILSHLYLVVLSQPLITTDRDICQQPSTDGLFVILFLKTWASHAICHFCPLSCENSGVSVSWVTSPPMTPLSVFLSFLVSASLSAHVSLTCLLCLRVLLSTVVSGVHAICPYSNALVLPV